MTLGNVVNCCFYLIYNIYFVYVYMHRHIYTCSYECTRMHVQPMCTYVDVCNIVGIITQVNKHFPSESHNVLLHFYKGLSGVHIEHVGGEFHGEVDVGKLSGKVNMSIGAWAGLM